MVPYFIVFTISILLCALYNDKRKWTIFAACILLSLFAGFRDKGIGTDTLVYTDQYFSYALSCDNIREIINNEMNYDICFLFLAYFGTYFVSDIWIFYFIIEFVIIFFFALAYLRLNKKNNINLVIFLAVYLLIHFNYSLNAMRQSCAMSIVLLAYSYLDEKKWIPFIIWEFVAYFFHSSAIITLSFIVFYWISNIQNEQKRILYTISSIILLIISTLFYYELLNYIGDLNILKEDYIDHYGMNSSFKSAAIIDISKACIVLLFYVIIFISAKRKIVDKKIIYFHFICNSIFLLSLFLSLYNMYAYRIGLYFFLISIYYFCVELSSVKINSIEKIISFSYLIFYWFYIFVIKGLSETIPYTSKILGI